MAVQPPRSGGRRCRMALSGGVSRVAKGADCKSAAVWLRRFESCLPHHLENRPEAFPGDLLDVTVPRYSRRSFTQEHRCDHPWPETALSRLLARMHDPEFQASSSCWPWRCWAVRFSITGRGLVVARLGLFQRGRADHGGRRHAGTNQRLVQDFHHGLFTCRDRSGAGLLVPARFVP